MLLQSTISFYACCNSAIFPFLAEFVADLKELVLAHVSPNDGTLYQAGGVCWTRRGTHTVPFLRTSLYSRKKGMPELSMSIIKSLKPDALGGDSVKPRCLIVSIVSVT